MDVIAILNNLLQSEQDNIFRFMSDGSPYVAHQLGELRRPLQEMIDANLAHSSDLAILLDNAGGTPTPIPRSIQPDEQYMAFLRLGFFIPKLIEEKQRQVARYESAIKQLGGASGHDNEEIVSVLKAHLADHKRHLQALNHAQANLPPAPATKATPPKPGELPPLATSASV